jgi:hypothetical protein
MPMSIRGPSALNSYFSRMLKKFAAGVLASLSSTYRSVRLASLLAAALIGERRVSARQGWAGEKSGLFEHPAWTQGFPAACWTAHDGSSRNRMETSRGSGAKQEERHSFWPPPASGPALLTKTATDDRVQLRDGVMFERVFLISATVLASRPVAVNSLSVAAAIFVRLPYCLSRRARVTSPMPRT